MSDEAQVIIENGEIRFIYNDDFVGLLNHGDPAVQRVSHVEPDGTGKWNADMSPVKGPMLGPYTLRADALAAEVEWLKDHNLPVPEAVT